MSDTLEQERVIEIQTYEHNGLSFEVMASLEKDGVPQSIVAVQSPARLWTFHLAREHWRKTLKAKDVEALLWVKGDGAVSKVAGLFRFHENGIVSGNSYHPIQKLFNHRMYDENDNAYLLPSEDEARFLPSQIRAWKPQYRLLSYGEVIDKWKDQGRNDSEAGKLLIKEIMRGNLKIVSAKGELAPWEENGIQLPLAERWLMERNGQPDIQCVQSSYYADDDIQAITERDVSPIGGEQVETIRVVAVQDGYYEHYRHRGDVFIVPEDMPLGSWMKPVDEVDMSQYAKPEPRVSSVSTLIEQSNLEGIAKTIDYNDPFVRLIQHCYLMAGYDMRCLLEDIPAYIEWNVEVKVLHAEALQAVEREELIPSFAYDANHSNATRATFESFLDWYVLKAKKPIKPIVKQLFKHWLGYKEDDGDIQNAVQYKSKNTVQHQPHEGASCEVSVWEPCVNNWLSENCELKCLSDVACIINDVIPLDLRAIEVIINLFPHDTAEALNCGVQEADQIQRIFNVLREHTPHRDDRATREEIETAMRILGLEWSEGFKETKVNVLQHREKLHNDSMYIIHHAALWGHDIPQPLIDWSFWGLAESCCFALGYNAAGGYGAFSGLETSRRGDWAAPLEQDAVDVFLNDKEQTRRQRYWDGDIYFKLDNQSGLRQLYCKAWAAVRDGSLPLLNEEKKQGEPYEWRLSPQSFVKWLSELSCRDGTKLYIRPQLRGFLPVNEMERITTEDLTPPETPINKIARYDGYRQAGQTGYLHDKVMDHSKEGDSYTVSLAKKYRYSNIGHVGWAYRLVFRFGTNGESILREEAACLLHGIEPINKATMHMVFSEFPEDIAIALQCFPDEEIEISRTYDKLNDYWKDKYIPIETLEQWMVDNGYAYPASLKTAMEEERVFNERLETEPVARINRIIWRWGQHCENLDFATSMRGLAKSCLMVLGKYNIQFACKTTLEQDVYACLSEAVMPWLGQDGLRELYQLALAAIDDNELAISNGRENPLPLQYRIKPETFVRWCNSNGIYIRPQLQRFLCEDNLPFKKKTAQGDDRNNIIDHLIERFDALIGEFGNQENSAYYRDKLFEYFHSDSFPNDIKKGYSWSENWFRNRSSKASVCSESKKVPTSWSQSYFARPKQ